MTPKTKPKVSISISTEETITMHLTHEQVLDLAMEAFRGNVTGKLGEIEVTNTGAKYEGNDLSISLQARRKI